ncbi:hypothetical protein BDR05DRAFT_845595, partial [Suillus weaverae]
DDEEEVLNELTELSTNIDREEIETVANDAGLNIDGDNIKGWVDEVAQLSDDEHLELQRNIRPIKLVLVKLRKLSYKLINSTTILLPAWHTILLELQMLKMNMPRDVATCWNSTFDMLEYAIEHRKAIDAVT